MKQHRMILAVFAAGAAMAACSGKDGNAPAADTGAAAPTASAAQSAPAVAPTGKIITVELNSDGNGNYFKPNEFEAHRGDVIRYVLKSGVHNVHFLPDSNPGKSNLPPASDMLQLPDQTLDIPVNFAEGTYYFQCDPHAALGMKGHVKVED